MDCPYEVDIKGDELFHESTVRDVCNQKPLIFNDGVSQQTGIREKIFDRWLEEEFQESGKQHLISNHCFWLKIVSNVPTISRFEIFDVRGSSSDMFKWSERQQRHEGKFEREVFRELIIVQELGFRNVKWCCISSEYFSFIIQYNQWRSKVDQS